jgi:hypothetical protein
MKTTQVDASGFFTLDKRKGRWWFITPQGKPFFSVGLNHIDWSPLCYAENGNLWRQKYANNIERWLVERVRPDLVEWGFNSVGWVQEVVTRGATNHRHTRGFDYEEYRCLDLPYCHLLPFADFHQWEAEKRLPNLASREFEDWCDYVARSECARLAEDPNLIGYFYLDCPTWVHTRIENHWRGPMFDPGRLASVRGRQELYAMARQYYRLMHDSVRRYDPHHLILGDRYEANASIPLEVVTATRGLVDVLCFQDFGSPVAVRDHLAGWSAQMQMPILVADYGDLTEIPGGWMRQKPESYRELLASLRDLPSCVGLHLCGAYLRNRCRRYGLRDEQEHPDEELLDVIREANCATHSWMDGIAASPAS